MTKLRFSRRDVLKSGAALAATVVASPLRAAPPAPEAITPALIEAAKKEGKLAFYTAMDFAFAGAAGQELRGEISRHRRARGALRRRAHLHPRCPGVWRQHQRGRCGQHRRCRALHRVEAQRLARALLAEEVAQHFDPQFYDADALHITTRILISPIAYNTNLVKKEEAPKSFADLLDPRWAGKMVKAHPATRHDHDRDVPDLARPRLGVSREARQAARPAGPVGDRHAEEDRARRARGHGRRRGLSRHPQQGGGPAGRDRLSAGGLAARSSGRARYSRQRRTRTPRACSRIGCTRAKPSRSWSTAARQYSPHRQTEEKPGARGLARHQADEGRSRGGREAWATRSRRATRKIFKV